MTEIGEQYRAAREGAACLDLADRGVLAVAGPQRQSFLHNILSNEVKSLKPGEGRLAALMDVKGHLQVLCRVLVAEDSVLLEAPSARVPGLKAALVHYKVGTPVRFEERETHVVGLLGPEALPRLAALGVEAPPEAAESHVVSSTPRGEVRAVRATDLPGSGFVLHAAAEAAAALLDALVASGAPLLGHQALDALRVEAGRPWFGIDVDAENLLHETGLLAQYHSSSKGCYVGQEVVARLEGRGGNVNRKLRGLRLGAPATPGAPVVAEGRPVGHVTTAALSPRLGPIAMAYVHRSHSDPGTAVEVAGSPATVVELPFGA